MPKSVFSQEIVHVLVGQSGGSLSAMTSSKSRRDGLARAVRQFVLTGRLPSYTPATGYERSMVMELEANVLRTNHVSVGPEERLWEVYRRMLASKRAFMAASRYIRAGETYLDRVYTWPVLSWELWELCKELAFPWPGEGIDDDVDE